MTRWALLVLMVLMLDGVFNIPATPIPAFQLSPHNFSQATPNPVISERPLTTTTGTSATQGHASSGPRLGPRITLSLDVPLGLLKILLEQARIRGAREQAAANALILARVGRR
ncbi:PREDICTED: urocortin-2 [Elephantulus edwardii]|uniref:urocortin-2 n=1 Tax=Elephantulus edwardii TaxID=28737 RepID=UPI0003F0BDE0|nr:PREDICTED: urocortin-2 [Elephantulus edwardii]